MDKEKENKYIVKASKSEELYTPCLNRASAKLLAGTPNMLKLNLELKTK